MAVKRQDPAARVLSDLLFDELDVGRCLVAPDGSILRANAEWVRSTGFTLADVLGADIIELFPEVRDMALAMHARARAGHRVTVPPRHALRVDGRETWWEGSIAPVPMEDGTGLLITARELSGRAMPVEPADPVVQEVELLRTVAGDAPFAVFAKAADGRYVFVNRYLAELLGTTPERSVFDILPSDVAVRTGEREQRAASGHLWTEDVIPTPTGVRTMLTVRFPMKLRNGEIGTCGVAFDITEQIEAREAANRAEDVLSHAGAMAQLGAWWIDVSNEADLNSNPLRWSDEVFRIFGYEPGEVPVTNDLFFQHVHADDRKLIVDAVARCITSGERYSVEHRIIRRDGVERIVLERGEARRDDSRRLLRMVGAVQDITDRKRIEAELRGEQARLGEESARLQAVFQAIPAGVAIADANGKILLFNDVLTRIWGGPPVPRSAAEYAEWRGWRRDSGKRLEAHEWAMARALSTGEVVVPGDVVEIERFDGSGRATIINAATPIRNAGGEIVGGVLAEVDISAQRRAEDALRASEERLRALVAASSDLVYRMSADWSEMRQLSRRNAGAEPDAPETTWMRRIPEDERPRVAAAIREAIQSKSIFELEHRLIREDGAVGWVFSRAVPLLDVTGAVTEWFGMASDVTERRRAEEELLAMNDQLRETDRRKTEFLAMLSHELRNPLAPIRNSLSLLERATPESEQATRAREVVRRQTEHLTRLIDDLLDVTRISHGKIPLERTRVDVCEILRKTTGDLHSAFTQAGVTLRVDYVPSGPLWIEADATRMAQVLTNLLSNAMKFTPSGGNVRVSIAARQGQAELGVIDDGIGMDPKDIEHMFEPFAQADHSLARTKGGLGLGLALVKSVVELHGGTIVARSEGLGRGAEFLIRIPLADSPAGSARPRHVPATIPRTILVIEDNVDGAQSLADILEIHGHRVRVARDGRSGIALAREVRPDVILCDIGLPDVDGYDVARALRSDGTLRDTRLVALSGYAQPEDRQRSRDAGFDAHLAKPVELDQLMALLASDR